MTGDEAEVLLSEAMEQEGLQLSAPPPPDEIPNLMATIGAAVKAMPPDAKAMLVGGAEHSGGKTSGSVAFVAKLDDEWSIYAYLRASSDRGVSTGGGVQKVWR